MSYEELDRKEKELTAYLKSIDPKIVPSQKEELIARSMATLRHRVNRLHGIEMLLEQDKFTIIKLVAECPAPFNI